MYKNGNFSNEGFIFFREMIEHCLECYGKKYIEEGKVLKVF